MVGNLCPTEERLVSGPGKRTVDETAELGCQESRIPRHMSAAVGCSAELSIDGTGLEGSGGDDLIRLAAGY